MDSREAFDRPDNSGLCAFCGKHESNLLDLPVGCRTDGGRLLVAAKPLRVHVVVDNRRFGGAAVVLLEDIMGSTTNPLWGVRGEVSVLPGPPQM